MLFIYIYFLIQTDVLVFIYKYEDKSAQVKSGSNKKSEFQAEIIESIRIRCDTEMAVVWKRKKKKKRFIENWMSN